MIRLRVPGTLVYRDVALRVVAAACKLVRESTDHASQAAQTPAVASDEFDNQVVSAFGEAFNNICIHGYRGRVAGDVDIEIEFDPTEISIRVCDTGTSYDPSSAPPPSFDIPRESGMGLYIINSFMDISYIPGKPNVLSMVKKRDALRSQDHRQ